MNNQKLALDVSKIRPEALKRFYDHILCQCLGAMQDQELYQEYLDYKKKMSSDVSTEKKKIRKDEY